MCQSYRVSVVTGLVKSARPQLLLDSRFRGNERRCFNLTGARSKGIVDGGKAQAHGRVRRLRDRARAQGRRGRGRRPRSRHAHRHGPARAPLAHGAPGRVRRLRGQCRRLFHGARPGRAAHRHTRVPAPALSSRVSIRQRHGRHPRAEGPDRQTSGRHEFPAGVQYLDARHPAGGLRPAAPAGEVVGRAQRGRGLQAAKDLRIEMIAPGKKLDRMLAEGEIPAMLSPELPRLFRAGDQRIVRLFPNYKDLELAYFRKTGIFPIMHVTTIKQEIVDKFPWVPTNLTKAFEQAKAIAYRRIANPRVVPLAWVRTMLEEQEELLGRDPWAYGLTPANRKNLETVLRYTFEQGMISKMLPLDALFADADLDDAGGSDGI